MIRKRYILTTCIIKYKIDAENLTVQLASIHRIGLQIVR